MLPKKSDFETQAQFDKRVEADLMKISDRVTTKNIFGEMSHISMRYFAEKQAFMADGGEGANVIVETNPSSGTELPHVEMWSIHLPQLNLSIPMDPKLAEERYKNMRLGVVVAIVPPFVSYGGPSINYDAIKKVNHAILKRAEIFEYHDVHAQAQAYMLYDEKTGEVFWYSPVSMCKKYKYSNGIELEEQLGACKKPLF